MKKPERIAFEIKKMIETGVYGEGERLPAERNLAEKFKTTQVTVNKAVSLLQNEGVVDKRQGSGNYILRKSRYKTVTFLVEEEGGSPNPIWYLGYQTFQMNAGAKGISVRLNIIPGNCYKITKNHFDSSELLVVALSLCPERVDSILSHGIPVIWLEEYANPLKGTTVCFDNFEAGRLAAEHMIGAGCRKFLYATFSMAHSKSGYGDYVSDRRFEGFRKGISEFGKGQCSIQYYSCLSGLSGFIDELKPYFENKEMIDGVLAFSDGIAFRVIKAAIAAGRNVPGDLAVMGIDGLRCGELYNPSLTSARQPVEKIGMKAFELAEKILFSNETASSVTKIKPELIIRESSVKSAPIILSIAK